LKNERKRKSIKGLVNQNKGTKASNWCNDNRLYRASGTRKTEQNQEIMSDKKVGYNDHRLIKDGYHDLEVAFNEIANKELKYNSMFLNQIANSRKTIYLTDHEEKIVLSVLQWLGTPVGQGFIEQAKQLTPKG
jgi:hypothetical protein